MNDLPKWIGAAGPEELGNLYRALEIAWEALSHLQFHSGRTPHEMEDAATEAMRRIEEIGK